VSDSEWYGKPQDQPLTEAEYRAWLSKRMPQIAAGLSEQFASVLPEGMRFGWLRAQLEPEEQ